MFSIKPRLKKDISETFFGLGLHFSVSAFGLDLKKNLGFPFFNLDTQENIQIKLGQFFQTLR